ncbi:MAG: hypothetical protein Kow00121_02120 [Elainellaceae cyanobacterium]
MLTYSGRVDAVSPVPTSSPNFLANPIAQSGSNVVDVAAAEGSFETFLSLMEELGMLEDLRGYGRFTVFMPTDQAFAQIPEATLEVLRSDRELMADILAYHIVSGSNPLFSDDLTSGESLRTLERSPIEIRRRRGNLYVNGVRVIDADIEASNGVIHAIDQVLLPPSLSETP